MNRAIEAQVLMVGDRYFAYYKNKRITTAWSLAGAHLFSDTMSENLEKYEEILNQKGYKSERRIVRLV